MDDGHPAHLVWIGRLLIGHAGTDPNHSGSDGSADRSADRELASVAVSRINGCVYCASVHGRLFAQLTKQPEIIQRIFDQGVDTELEPRARAIVDYAVKLTVAPELTTRSDLSRLRSAGLSELEILDLTHVVAMFAWANRLLQTLGEPIASGIRHKFG